MSMVVMFISTDPATQSNHAESPETYAAWNRCGIGLESRRIRLAAV
jgi:hypothetical protein